MIDLRDVAELDRPKAGSALALFRFEVLEDPESSAFEAAYGMLDAFFGAKGELEERSALARFTRERVIPYGPGLEGHYRMVVAWAGKEIAGVRDCYVDLDLSGRMCLVALSHAYIAPPWRRSGLGALFRALPATLARRTVEERFSEPETVPIVVAAEMEPADPAQPDTVVRLIAYGRSGFSVLDPRRVPYSQPDFRDLEGLGATHTAIPLLPVVRWVDQPEARSMPPALAAAYPRLFHVCHRLYLPAWRVDPSEAHALGALAASSEDVPILPLPTGPDELGPLAPLVRGAVLPLYPPGLRGPDPSYHDAEEELRLLRARWTAAGPAPAIGEERGGDAASRGGDPLAP